VQIYFAQYTGIAEAVVFVIDVAWRDPSPVEHVNPWLGEPLSCDCKLQLLAAQLAQHTPAFALFRL